ncbi:hypothetical protein WAI453_012549 [Rhynchosporium graminicola]
MALVFWLIPATTFFIPGATIVVALAVNGTFHPPVPFFNSSGIGSGTTRDISSTNLFKKSINDLENTAGISMFIPNDGASQIVERLTREVIV